MVTATIPNCRPLTRKPNAEGRLPREDLMFRSATPAAAGDAAAEWLGALGIRHIYDLRSELEIRQGGTIELSDVTRTHTDVLAGVGAEAQELVRVLDDPEGMMLRLYRRVFPSRVRPAGPGGTCPIDRSVPVSLPGG